MASENTTYIIYLIELAKNGRHSGYLELCELHLKSVYTLINRLIGNQEISIRLTVNTFITIWDEIKDFNTDKSFSDYVKNIAIDLSVSELLLNSNIKPDESQKEPPKNKIELAERLLRRLPAETKVIFVLHDLEKYSYEKVQGFFPGMIIDELKTKLIEARQYLMRKLEL